jgi:hypothetical protein
MPQRKLFTKKITANIEFWTDLDNGCMIIVSYEITTILTFPLFPHANVHMQHIQIFKKKTHLHYGRNYHSLFTDLLKQEVQLKTCMPCCRGELWQGGM